jgi:hypothetical protein
VASVYASIWATSKMGRFQPEQATELYYSSI